MLPNLLHCISLDMETKKVTLQEIDDRFRNRYVDNIETSLSKEEIAAFLKHEFQTRIVDEMYQLAPHLPPDELSDRCLYISNAVNNEIERRGWKRQSRVVRHSSPCPIYSEQNTTESDQKSSEKVEGADDEQNLKKTEPLQSQDTTRSRAKKGNKGSKESRKVLRIRCRDGCKYDYHAKGNMIRCCLCMDWSHSECVNESYSDEVGIWNCQICRKLPTTVQKIEATLDELKSLLKTTVETNNNQLTKIKELNQTVSALTNENRDLQARNFILSEDLKTEQRKTKQVTGERQKILQELIEEKQNNERQIQSSSPPVNDTATDSEDTSNKTSDDEDDGDDDDDEQWCQAKPIPRSIGRANTIVIGDSVLKSLHPKRLSDSISHPCSVDSVRGASVATIAARIQTVLHQAEAAERILILVGGNDLATSSAQEFEDNFKILLHSLEDFPDIKPMVFSILPRTQPSSFNDGLPKFNRILRRLCKGSNTQFIDCGYFFPKSHYKDLLDRDGVHLSRKGVGRLATCITSSLGGRQRRSPNERTIHITEKRRGKFSPGYKPPAQTGGSRGWGLSAPHNAPAPLPHSATTGFLPWAPGVSPGSASWIPAPCPPYVPGQLCPGWPTFQQPYPRLPYQN